MKTRIRPSKTVALIALVSSLTVIAHPRAQAAPGGEWMPHWHALTASFPSGLYGITVLNDTSSALPYAQLVPTTAPHGTTVNLYGSNFCATAGCSPVTVKIGDRVIASDVQVSHDGKFQVAFKVTEFPGRYLVTASQLAAGGSMLKDAPPLLVPATDSESTAQSRGAQEPPTGETVRSIQGSLFARMPAAAVTEFQPDVQWGGRTVAVDIKPGDSNTALAATESGGIFKTTDGGSTWTHTDTLVPFRMSSVKYNPADAKLVIATTWDDSRSINGGGILRSTDGGATWQKPATADPPTGPRCPARYQAWGIAFAPGTSDVFVGTDCGVAVSHDLGATWSHVVPDPASPDLRVYAVVAQTGGFSGSLVDIYGADGHHRSVDGGGSWTTTSGALLPAPFAAVHSIDVSPLDPNVLFAAASDHTTYESDDGGTSWSNLLVPPPVNPSRPAFAKAHLSKDGDAAHFDLYSGNTVDTFFQTCTTPAPARRCSASWTTVDTSKPNYHSDPSNIAYASTGNCPIFLSSDGGVAKTPDCGVNWPIIGAGSGGFNALQLYEGTGQVHPDHTDLYFGTHDNDIWASEDNGATWPFSRRRQYEGFFLQVPHSTPSDVGQTITGMSCFSCDNFKASAHLTNQSVWNNPDPKKVPPVGPVGNPFLIDTGVYVQFAQPSPPSSQLYISTDTGANWNPVLGAVIAEARFGRMQIAGPPASPTIYNAIRKPGGKYGLRKITGIRTASATVSAADTGLGDIGGYCMGQGTWVCESVFGVDPNNSQNLIAADRGTNQMKVSTNGGASWQADTVLTSLVTNNGEFLFDNPPNLGDTQTQVHSIAFDPSNGNHVLVGTEAAGVFVSLNGGKSWGRKAMSDRITAISSFFFDEAHDETIASSYGRGLWKLDSDNRSLAALSPAKLFVGLRNSDDQGTQFDLQADVKVNGSLVASGLTRCVTGVTRNPAKATEVTVPFAPLTLVPVVPGDVMSVKISTRIGTRPDDTKCPGPGGSHNSAVGLRLYYDSVSQPSRFDALISPEPERDFVLHSNGGPCANAPSVGVTTRFLDNSAPTGIKAKCQDSGVLNFATGNAWKEIGTWASTIP